MEEIAQAVGISHGSISTILHVHDRLGMRKLTAPWVSKFLSDINQSISMQYLVEGF